MDTGQGRVVSDPMGVPSRDDSPIRVFVGTDQRMGRAERVLEYSIRKHASRNVEITWMRHGDAGFGDEWNRGPDFTLPYQGRGWATGFSCFRFAVPELCEWKGKAIYLDADMIVLSDIAEIADHPSAAPCLITRKGRFDVIRWDCAGMKRPNHEWPALRDVKPSGRKPAAYQMLLDSLGVVGRDLDPLWDVLDTHLPSAKLVHYTNMHWQPWHPWPERFQYPKVHPQPSAQALWDRYEKEAHAAAR